MARLPVNVFKLFGIWIANAIAFGLVIGAVAYVIKLIIMVIKVWVQ